jgi:hypothetical protein
MISGTKRAGVFGMGGGIAGVVVGGAGNAMVKLSGVIGSAHSGGGVEMKKREENVKVRAIGGVGRVGGDVGSAKGTGMSRGSGRVLTAVTLDCCGTRDEFNVELGVSVGAAVGFFF